MTVETQSKGKKYFDFLTQCLYVLIRMIFTKSNFDYNHSVFIIVLLQTVSFQINLETTFTLQIYEFEFICVFGATQDHRLRCGGRAKCHGHQQVTRRLHHGRLPVQEGGAASHPGGTTRRGRLSQRESQRSLQKLNPTEVQLHLGSKHFKHNY